MKINSLILLFALQLFGIVAFAQEKKKEFTEAIEDNSYFIEEAYNQEERVVQHIFNLYTYGKPSKDQLFSFTQEWPLLSYKHQISYTIPYSFIDKNTIHGVGDILINYRYQLFYNDDWACVAPRFSLILPTGDSKKGFGNDVVGFQINIPVSKRLSNEFAAHANIGATCLPGVKWVDNLLKEQKKNITSYFYGGSLIYLLSTNFNFMLEVLHNANGEINDAGKQVWNGETIINPGIRFAINVGKLQIVPGISVPITRSTEANKTGVFFYLSFEHPY